MKTTFLLVMLAGMAACVSGPAPKAPDEANRVPVNRMTPPEVELEVEETADGSGPKRARKPRDSEVQWR